MSSCTTHYVDPWKSEPWLSIYFKYPFSSETSPLQREHGADTGLEIRRDGSEVAYMLLFPNRGEPRKLYIQNDGYDRFIKDWESIGLMEFRQERFDDRETRFSRNGEELVQLAPFDDRTLIVAERQGDKLVTLSIYAPDYFADTHMEHPEGKALRAALDLFARVIGESML